MKDSDLVKFAEKIGEKESEPAMEGLDIGNGPGPGIFWVLIAIGVSVGATVLYFFG